MSRPLTSLLAATSLLTLGLAACATGAPSDSASSEDGIIGGVEVTSARLDAVGSLQLEFGGNPRQTFCTGTLISPTIVITAKHCARIRLGDGQWHYFTDLATVYFAIGNDAANPRKLVKATRALGASFEGPEGSLGSDVAIYALSEPITDVTPLPIAKAGVTTGDVGATFSAIGYGVRDAEGNTGKRLMGNITLSLREGQPWKVAYPTFDEFKAFLEERLQRPLTADELPVAQAMWEEPLLPEYEAFFGAKDGDVQPCSGDSGGPLLRRVDGVISVHGVASWVPQKFAASALCARGTTYATFGPSAAELIANAACHAEPLEGRCDGTVAIRCAGVAEGGPRVTKTRCDELGLVCAVGADGKAGCVDGPTP